MNKIYKEIDILLENIKMLRKKFHLSKKSMAQIMGISVESINKIESGKCPEKLKIDILFRLEKFFSIPVYKLFLSQIISSGDEKDRKYTT